MEITLQDEQVADLTDLIIARKHADTEIGYNALTVAIIEKLGSMRFKKTAITPPFWVQLMGELLAVIARGEYPYPFKFDQERGEDVLCIRTSHIMEHMWPWIRDRWVNSPIKTDRGLKKQLRQTNAVLTFGDGSAAAFERTLGGQRVGHLTAIRLIALKHAGLKTLEASQAVYVQPKP